MYLARAVMRSAFFWTSPSETGVRPSGRDSGGAVARLQPRPKSSSEPSTTSAGRDSVTTSGRRSVLGESGIPASPTPVVRMMLPVVPPLPDIEVAVTIPVFKAIKVNSVVFESPAARVPRETNPDPETSWAPDI